MVVVLSWRLFLYTPIEVGQEKGNSASDPGKVVVIENDDASPAQQTPKVEEIQEHAVEAMVPIHEREIELAPFLEKRRQSDLRDLIVVLHEGVDTRFLEYLEAAVGESPCLKRIQNYMTRIRMPGTNQAFADAERRDAIREANLDGPGRLLSKNPSGEGFSFSGADGDCADVVCGPVTL
jgi:hypothetical protein